MVKIAAIAAMDESRIIGNKNSIPWNYSEDKKHFATLTMGQTVLMGRKTYESLPQESRPLKGRLNIVVGRNLKREDFPEDVLLVDNLTQFISDVHNEKIAVQGDTLWIIGGGQIYEQTLSAWEELYLTVIKGAHEGDVKFPNFEEFMTLESEEKLSDELTFKKFSYKKTLVL